MKNVRIAAMAMAMVAVVALGVGGIGAGEADAMYYGYVPNGMGETLEMAYWWYFLR
ncbi:hypothetical protein [Paenibacillus mucilaginosus]|uniref:Uncharacterized protein n=3 Tax=Paenibacillus mucilaginosus TaxID=61624 RepID=H6NGQ7_9BACL|nr:hypothetical protein [Paenibacillus mucilaginosus]AEI46360.1 hypothetical protein KNP414_07875 [Paenibacillus mucilaginosus KNP414]AFC33960.1 hypothetical protein PM3016_7392 [Paenibacillus mucilaginosus 3016]AFH66292.1 hypothetical protein B2K_37295 [Paenibacillus mucilaginosus K02]MCG7213527.1 hypothetical protein [Paenibacillus mucilaginosus]WDM27657.1 hypothetical protein KCX80_35870 [Paenibacillus mucilaginosus]